MGKRVPGQMRSTTDEFSGLLYYGHARTTDKWENVVAGATNKDIVLKLML